MSFSKAVPGPQGSVGNRKIRNDTDGRDNLGEDTSAISQKERGPTHPNPVLLPYSTHVLLSTVNTV